MKLPQTNLCLQLPLYSCCNVIFEYSGQRHGMRYANLWARALTTPL